MTDITTIFTFGERALGIDSKTGELYWDGAKVVTERRLSDPERWLAGIAVAATVVAALAAIIQAWAAVATLHAQFPMI